MTSFPVASDVRRALQRKFLAATIGGHSSRLVAQDADAAADAAMAVVGPVLEARDAEIARLRGLLAAYVLTGEREIGSEGEGS